MYVKILFYICCMEKQIVLIGCGSEGRLQEALAKVIKLNHEAPAVVYHTVSDEIDNDELRALALRFQEQDYQVLIDSAGLDIVKELQPEPFNPERLTLKLTAPLRLDPEYMPSLKELNKPPVYPKKSWKSKRKRNR